jgi:hydroxyacylglutathione hydrolase
VHRILLGNAVFEGENAVYLLGADADGPTTLVDVGANTPAVREDLEAGLADAGLALAAVDQVLLTHHHADHVGLAGAVQAASDATVSAHAADAPLIARDDDAWAAVEARHDALFDEWGMPDDARADLRAFLDGHDVRGDPADVTPFDDGAAFDAGETDLEAVHLPGHAAGLVGFAADLDGERVLFSGDAVLPHYTPNVGGADVRVDDAIAQYADSLVRVVEGDYDRIYPGHRDPIDDPSGRALDILAHHRDRTRNVVDALRDLGTADAWTVSAHLFGDLEHIHILHGPGEAWAHLEHLADAGIVEKVAEGYRLVETEPDVAGLFPEPVR